MAMTKGDGIQVNVSREVIEKIKIKFQWIINMEFEIKGVYSVPVVVQSLSHV